MEQSLYLVVSLFVGLIVGAAASWLVLRERLASTEMRLKGDSQVELARFNERLAASQEDNKRMTIEHAALLQQATTWRDQLDTSRDECAQLAERAAGLNGQLDRAQLEKETLTTERDQLIAERQRLGNQVAELTASLNAERKLAEENLAILSNAKDQFKVLANEILEDKTQRFTAQNQTNLNQLLEPLKVKITEFQGKVQEVYVQEGKDRSALAEQVKQLMSLNNQLSKDAHNLTSALKGQAKAQGNWGELILERVLEASGLRKGFEYDVQESHTRSDGSRAQPDVVVHLPEDRHLIVDAKVSLTAYEEHANAETDAQREAALKRHLDSVRGHIRELSEKNYQQLYGLKSLDFVLMFIPVEPAFMLAISHDSELWQDAWKKNVLLVSPSTLLFVVRTVAHLWRQEQQNRNAQDIASRGAALYDKLVGFVEDMEGLGVKLKQAQASYDGALNKFSTGSGNVIRQAEKLKELGVKPTKHLPQKLIDVATDGVKQNSAISG
ncbi:MAG: DNA recombination protein RmuC [Nitrosomonadales bacterium]|nr:DNA recombination protein RmuC [Nitrosomonadales bacterium]